MVVGRARRHRVGELGDRTPVRAPRSTVAAGVEPTRPRQSRRPTPWRPTTTAAAPTTTAPATTTTRRHRSGRAPADRRAPDRVGRDLHRRRERPVGGDPPGQARARAAVLLPEERVPPGEGDQRSRRRLPEPSDRQLRGRRARAARAARRERGDAEFVGITVPDDQAVLVQPGEESNKLLVLARLRHHDAVPRSTGRPARSR